MSSSSSIIKIRLFLDNRIMTLGGHLHEATTPYRVRLPIILPKKCNFTNKIILNAHVSTIHGGVNSTLTQGRKNFWIIQCRQRIKRLLSKCIVCKKLKAKAANEPFAPLPRDRLSMATPFKVTGTDFAGPLYIATELNEREKCYVMLFSCAVIRAVHLEIVPNLSTNSCMNAVRGFVARWGVPDIIYSDNAKTFKRASLEFHEVNKIVASEEIQNFASKHRISWRFTVERAACWGGFWERMVKLIKDTLKWSIGRRTLNYEECDTILSVVEATVNSRPLTYVSKDIDNFMILTPAHLLVGGNECVTENVTEKLQKMIF